MTLKGKTEIETLRARLENSAKAQERLTSEGKDHIAAQFAEADIAFAERLARLQKARTPQNGL
jgi:hypothetical protein